MKLKNLTMPAALAIAVATVAHATPISNLDTGAGLYGINNSPNDNAVATDPNWRVSLLSSDGTPPGGIPTGTAYLVPNNIGFPFGYWVNNDATSSWITYSNPVQLNGDTTDDLFQYQLTFTADTSGIADVRWMGDNDNWLYVNGDLIGSNPNQYRSWNAPVAIDLTAGTSYTVDLDVYNEPQGSGNPTGARVEFLGPVTVTPGSVPDSTTSLTALLLGVIPIGALLLRRSRKGSSA
jgi:hypothetical protein